MRITLTFPYFHVKTTTIGRQQMMMQERTRIVVRITQSRDTTQGRSSSQDSHPSGHGKHSNTPSLPYWFSSPCKEKEGFYVFIVDRSGHIHQTTANSCTRPLMKTSTDLTLRKLNEPCRGFISCASIVCSVWRILKSFFDCLPAIN